MSTFTTSRRLLMGSLTGALLVLGLGGAAIAQDMKFFRITSGGVKTPIHPGAEKYYRGKGILKWGSGSADDTDGRRAHPAPADCFHCRPRLRANAVAAPPAALDRRRVHGAAVAHRQQEQLRN